jgi:hypothetical protein
MTVALLLLRKETHSRHWDSLPTEANEQLKGDFIFSLVWRKCRKFEDNDLKNIS